MLQILQSIYYAPGYVPGTRNTAIKKNMQKFLLSGHILVEWKQIINEINKLDTLLLYAR